MAVENWSPIQNYEGRYAVSDLGNVMSMNYHRTGLPGILSPGKSGAGYQSVNLCDSNGRITRHLVHKLVAEAFIGARPAGMQINHRDGLKTNNRATNLEYCTPSENKKHAFRIGLQSMRGERHNRAKLTDEKVRAIRRLAASGMRYADIAVRIGVNHHSISDVVLRKAWSHVVDEVLQ